MDKKFFFGNIYEERIAYRLTLSFALMGIIPMLLSTYIIATLWLPSLNVWTQVGLLLAFSLLISLLGYLLSRTIVRTILKTSEAAKEIADGNLSKRIEIHNERSEITTLVDSFNRITAQLEQKIKDVQSSEEKYKHLVDNVPDLLYYLEPSGVISSMNEEVRDLLGYDAQELAGKPFSDIVHPEDYVKYESKLLERRSDERRLTKGLRIRLRMKTGEFRVFEINSRGTYDHQNNFLGTEGLARDITAQLALETEREEFLYMLTHDIKNPVSAIVFIVSMMRDGTIAPEKFLEYYERIDKACNGITTLVQEFLEFKKLERGHTELDIRRLNMPALLKNIVQTYQPEARAKGKDLRFTVEEEGGVFALVDEKYFPRAVENLVTNAIKFAQSRIDVEMKSGEAYLNILVRDDGPGVPEEEKEHIFKLFHRAPGARMVKGIGIGLASAEKIVRAHGGRLYVDTSNGAGCTFVIMIPKDLNGADRAAWPEESSLSMAQAAS
jgi:PAS domain S-box-containing protein